MKDLKDFSDSPVSPSPSGTRRSFLVSDIVTVGRYQLLWFLWSLLLIVEPVVVPSVLLIFPYLLLLSFLRVCLRFYVVISHLVGRTIIVLVKRAPFRNVLWVTPVLVIVQLFLWLLLFLTIPAFS